MSNIGSDPPAVLTSLPQLDVLRDDPESTWIRSENSNIDELRDAPNSKTTSDDNIAICQLHVLMPWTEGQQFPVQDRLEDVAAISLAAHHLNIGDGSIIPQVKGLHERCRIRFTTEIDDTQYDPGLALKQMVNVTSREPGTERLPCSFLGAYRSAVSIPTSILTGLLDYPQISGTSTSADLDDKNQYPLFARTIPSDHGNAFPIIQFFDKELGVEHLAVININDAFGNSFVQGLRSAAQKIAPGMKIHQAAFDDDPISMKSALESVKQTKYKYIFALLFSNATHDVLLEQAYEFGIAGTGRHQWFFGDGFNSISDRVFEANSPLHLAYMGVGRLEASGGALGVGLVGFDRFSKQLSKLNNPEDLEYLFSKLPEYDNDRYRETVESWGAHFETVTSNQATFWYEAVIALGLAACETVQQSNSTDRLKLDGREHYRNLVNSVFDGVNGAVVFNPLTGSKDPTSTIYKVTNYFPEATSSGSMQYQESFSHLFRGGSWEELEPYIFADGSPNIPADIPASTTVDNDLSAGVRASVLMLCAILLILGVFFMQWTHRNRKTRVVLASQPFFLHIICIGVIIMGTSIIPFSIDHSIADVDGCSIACNATIWLSTLGFAITECALLTKTRRVNIILNSPNRLKRIKVTIWDVAKPMVALVSANIVLLSLMSGLAPAEYLMYEDGDDGFGRPDSVRGQCVFKDSLPYLLTQGALNFGAFILTIAQAYKARNLSTEFSESSFIFRSLIAIVLVLFVGGPVVLLAGDNANAFVFVVSAIVFVGGGSILLLMFVPKMQYLRTWKNNKSKRNMRVHISGLEASGAQSRDTNVDSFVEDTDEYAGMRILTTKTPKELVKEVEELKRLLKREKEKTSMDEEPSRTKTKCTPTIHSIMKRTGNKVDSKEDSKYVRASSIRDSTTGSSKVPTSAVDEDSDSTCDDVYCNIGRGANDKQIESTLTTERNTERQAGKSSLHHDDPRNQSTSNNGSATGSFEIETNTDDDSTATESRLEMLREKREAAKRKFELLKTDPAVQDYLHKVEREPADIV